MSAKENSEPVSIDILVVGDVFQETLIIPISQADHQYINAGHQVREPDNDFTFWRVTNPSGAFLLAEAISAACSYKYDDQQLPNNPLRLYHYYGFQMPPHKQANIAHCKELLTTLALFPQRYKDNDTTRVYRIDKSVGPVNDTVRVAVGRG